ncbi:hypothetical protein BG030_06865 [Pseudomonas putida]|nr:hypothetical protein BG030_06865 [Pseudomonas putida]
MHTLLGEGEVKLINQASLTKFYIFWIIFSEIHCDRIHYQGLIKSMICMLGVVTALCQPLQMLLNQIQNIFSSTFV